MPELTPTEIYRINGRNIHHPATNRPPYSLCVFIRSEVHQGDFLKDKQTHTFLRLQGCSPWNPLQRVVVAKDKIELGQKTQIETRNGEFYSSSTDRRVWQTDVTAPEGIICWNIIPIIHTPAVRGFLQTAFEILTPLKDSSRYFKSLVTSLSIEGCNSD